MVDAYRELEEKWQEFSGCQNTVAVSSGTSALHLALEAFDLPRYAPVLVPEFTMVACARAVTLAGLNPVFVDCGDDLLIDVSKLKKHLTRYTKAIMAVHIYGRQCNMEAISEFAKEYGLFVIEDLAEATGVKQHPDTDAACWSFYRNKIVAGEEGGMIGFRCQQHADKTRMLRSLGFDENHNFTHLPRGINARMSNVHAREVLDSLAWYNENLADRYQLEEWYNAAMIEAGLEAWVMPLRKVVWVYDIRIPGMTSTQQDIIVMSLRNQRIEARHGFKPMSQQPEYRGWTMNGDLRADRLSREVIYLPTVPGMTHRRVLENVQALVEATAQAGVVPSQPSA